MAPCQSERAKLPTAISRRQTKLFFLPYFLSFLTGATVLFVYFKPRSDHRQRFNQSVLCMVSSCCVCCRPVLRIREWLWKKTVARFVCLVLLACRRIYIQVVVFPSFLQNGPKPASPVRPGPTRPTASARAASSPLPGSETQGLFFAFLCLLSRPGPPAPSRSSSRRRGNRSLA